MAPQASPGAKPPAEAAASTPTTGWRRLREPRFWRRVVVTYATATLGGWLAVWAGIPLPWMLGPFFLCGFLTIVGCSFGVLPGSRIYGQVAVGLAVGLRFTLDVLLATATLFPAMVIATLYMVTCTTAAAVLFRRLAGVDHTTAFFATAAGGVADMAIVAASRGGTAASVAIVHALRLSCTVAIVPFLIVGFGERGAADTAAEVAGASAALFAPALIAAFATAWACNRARLPNPWIIGGMLLGFVVALGDLASIKVPELAIILAQIAMGTWLGCQLKREVFAALPRVAASGMVVALLLIALAGAGALMLSRATGLPITTSFLALAPAGITEMVLTAKAMQLEAEFVTAFHVMRIAVVSSTVIIVFSLYLRLTRLVEG